MKLEGGLKVKSTKKNYEVNYPIITIVTVVYDGEHEIEETIRSVVGQSYKNIEYIIVDGDSNDNTLEIVKKYDDKIDYWLSEKDNGIYDAMNKSIGLATGDWINFMNAGDIFSSEDILKKIFMNNNLSDYDVVYGNNYYTKNGYTYLQKALELNCFHHGMRFNHQSSFVRLSLMKNFMFDLTWRIQCEYDLFLKLYLNNHKFRHINEIVAVYRDGGFSEQNNLERTLERWLINKRLKNNQANLDKFYLVSLIKNMDEDSGLIDKGLFLELVQGESKNLSGYKDLMNSLYNTSQTKFISHPFEKFKNYKKLMNSYGYLPQKQKKGGVRLRHNEKIFADNIPLVTVVTVVYNGESEIERTIKSVLKQTYKNVEYIIVDGASKDKTLDVVKKYDDQIDYWISEKDNGLYDAMNKAIQFASGEWINFMNAGDTFASDDTLEKIFMQTNLAGFDFLYGSYYLLKNNSEKKFMPVRPLELIWQRICFSHQSLFSKTELMKNKPFDLSYKIVCDYENYFSRYMEGKKFLDLGFPVSVFLSGGVSDLNFFKRTRERWRIVKAYKKGLNVNVDEFYFKLILKYYIYDVLLFKIKSLKRHLKL